jgi:hypothetical protein
MRYDTRGYLIWMQCQVVRNYLTSTSRSLVFLSCVCPSHQGQYKYHTSYKQFKILWLPPVYIGTEATSPLIIPIHSTHGQSSGIYGSNSNPRHSYTPIYNGLIKTFSLRTEIILHHFEFSVNWKNAFRKDLEKVNSFVGLCIISQVVHHPFIIPSGTSRSAI